METSNDQLVNSVKDYLSNLNNNTGVTLRTLSKRLCESRKKLRFVLREHNELFQIQEKRFIKTNVPLYLLST
jgi:predicted transcriptional regulator